LSCALPAIAAAQAQLEPVVVSATRTEQALAETLPHATVMTRADIERRQATDLVDLLASEAGIEFARAGSGQASLFMRGANSSQVLLLIDGVRVNSVIGGGPTLGGITADAIERIEIVRGNLSSLYGSEAIGGVIQIFTRADGSGADASAEAGEGQHRAAAAGVRYAADGTRLSLRAGVRRSEAVSAIDPARVIVGPFTAGANPDVDGYQQRSVSLNASQRMHERLEFGGSYWANRRDTDFDSTGDGPDAVHREHAKLDAGSVYVSVAPTDVWRIRLRGGQSNDNSRNTSNVPTSFSNSELRARNRQVTLQNDLRWSEQLALQFGLEEVRSKGGSTSFDPGFSAVFTEFERDVNSAFAGAVGNLGAHRLQANVRYDDYSDAGDATTGLVAYGYQLTPSLRASAQVSTAFRAPSFNDLYFPFFGNPQLKPERARSGEVGLAYAQGPTSVRAALYRTRTRDLIVFDGQLGTVNNVARARADGFELAARTQLGAWRLGAGVTLVRPIDETTGERLLRRAPYAVNASAFYEDGAWSAGAETSRVGARYDSDINTFARIRLAPYTLVRLLGAYRVNQNVRLRLRIENAFDEEYTLVDGYNTQPRTAIVGVEVRL
jgi:vitamin B12 transporter